jgi:hypothetical protein
VGRRRRLRGRERACRSRDRSGQQAPRRSRSHRPSRRQVQPTDLFPVGRRTIVSSSGARPLHRRGRGRAGAARSRCRGAAALLSVEKHLPRPSVQCTPTFARMTANNRRAHASPAAGRAWEQQSAAATRAVAISKAGARGPDAGRVVRHGPSRRGRLLLRQDAIARRSRFGPGDRGRQRSRVRAKRSRAVELGGQCPALQGR